MSSILPPLIKSLGPTFNLPRNWHFLSYCFERPVISVFYFFFFLRPCRAFLSSTFGKDGTLSHFREGFPFSLICGRIFYTPLLFFPPSLFPPKISILPFSMTPNLPNVLSLSYLVESSVPLDFFSSPQIFDSLPPRKRRRLRSFPRLYLRDFNWSSFF